MNLCTGCNRNFSGLTTFDKHQRGVFPVVCLDPATIGLVEKNGTWQSPEGTFSMVLNGKLHGREEAAEFVKPLPKLFCACGTEIVRTGQRGRPPTRCEVCRAKAN